MGLTRRQLLAAFGGGTAGVLTVATAAHVHEPTKRTGGFEAGAQPLRTAMHVHGSWSEGRASWSAQLAQAAAAGVDLLYLTDHDHRMVADGYLTSLRGAVWESSTSGTALSTTMRTPPTGALRLAVESAGGAPATATLTVEPEKCAKNYLRTSISGLVVKPRFGAVTLTGAAVWELTLELSLHPATASRAAGALTLVYRFGSARTGRVLENGGLTGVVLLPAPEPGSTATLVPTDDVKALWPTMWAQDNVFYGLSFTATSPQRGARSDVALSGVAFTRKRSTAVAAVADQRSMVRAYAGLHPEVAMRQSTEVGGSEMHFNPFGIPPMFPDYAALGSGLDVVRQAVVADVHAAGGAVSLNHALGFQSTAADPQETQDAHRRTVFTELHAQGAYGIDVLEVGYNRRGKCTLETHLALWDTFSRNGYYLTGNGVSDDHGGVNWLGLGNGFLTGLWSGSGDEEVVGALRSGRAFFYHPGRWPDGSLDLLLDGSVPMGSVLVTDTSSHRLAIAAPRLPPGFTAEVVSGPVDRSGATDPGTRQGTPIAATSFVSGVAEVAVSAPTSRFVRVQVRSAAGGIVAGSNPVWILRDPPSSSIPAARR